MGVSLVDGDLESLRRDCLARVERVVVKVGSAVLAGDGKLSQPAVARLAGDLAAVRRAGVEVVLVSSGAVASGFRRLGLVEPPCDITNKQAAAAIGQPMLMAAYRKALAKHRLEVGQVLLTASDLEHRSRFLNARHTMSTLLQCGVLPIVNENDSVAVDEIKLGDNDHLSVLVANLVSADLLVLLTNVDGILQGGNSGTVVPVIPVGQSAAEHIDNKTQSTTGVGGMTTKVQAAELACGWGIPAIVANGNQPEVLRRIVAGTSVGTFFVPTKRRVSARKRWIAAGARAQGVITIDEGAAKALMVRGSSLLPSGIVGVEEAFARGATVQIAGPDGVPIARGLTTYNAEEIDRIRGRRSSEIQNILGYTYGEEVVHRDDMVLTASVKEART